jgi:signal transduction histidine kinase
MARKLIACIIIFCFIFEQAGFAQVAPQLGVPAYLQNLVPVADKFRPVHLRSISLDPATNNFNLFLDKGDARPLQKPQLEAAAQKLLEYFKIGLTLPNSMFWVNLRPDSPRDVIDPYVERTDLGKVMLEADLQLKKDMARFTAPNTPEGKAYWDKLYQKAEALYGGQDMEIPTVTRPWIVPGEIIIGESKDGAYVYKATLNVMLEQDYLRDTTFYSFDDDRVRQLNDYSSQILRELIIPKLTREVNASRSYAGLRQVFYSLILAQWFKQKFSGREGEYASRIDTKDLAGLTSTAKWSKDTYYQAYKKSFSQGEYNRQESVYGAGETIRSYFSGGIQIAPAALDGGNIMVIPMKRVVGSVATPYAVHLNTETGAFTTVSAGEGKRAFTFAQDGESAGNSDGGEEPTPERAWKDILRTAVSLTGDPRLNECELTVKKSGVSSLDRPILSEKGKVVIEITKEDSGFVFVMCHELAHRILGGHRAIDSKPLLIRQAVISIGLLAVAVPAIAFFLEMNLGLGIAFACFVAAPICSYVLGFFPRAAEFKADYIGALLMHAAGYDMAEGAAYFQRHARHKNADDSRVNIILDRALEVLMGAFTLGLFSSGHPGAEARSKNLGALAAMVQAEPGVDTKRLVEKIEDLGALDTMFLADRMDRIFGAAQERAAARKDGGAGVFDKQQALERIGKFTDAVKSGTYQKGTPVVDLRNIPDGTEVILVGDLHARRDNLEKILSDGDNLARIKSGKAVLVILGDAVHDEEDLREMDSSVAIMQRIMDLKISSPDSVYYLLGNHDYLSDRVSKGGVAQGAWYAAALKRLFGPGYIEKYEAFLKASPLLVVGDGFAAAHAGPVRANKDLNDIARVNVTNDYDSVVDQLIWGRFKHPRHYYDLTDVKNFLSRLGLKEDASFIVGHSPARDGNWRWAISPQHHVIFAAEHRTGYARIIRGKVEFIEVKDGGQSLSVPLPGNDFLRVDVDTVKVDGAARAAFERVLDGIRTDLALPPDMAGHIKRNTVIVSKHKLMAQAKDNAAARWIYTRPRVSVLFGGRLHGAGDDVSVVIVDALEPASLTSDVRLAAEIGHIILHQFHPEAALDQAVGETYDLLCKVLTHRKNGNTDIGRILIANGARVVERIAGGEISDDPSDNEVIPATKEITDAWETLGIDERLRPTRDMVRAEIRDPDGYPHFCAAYIMGELYRYHRGDFAATARALIDAAQDRTVDFSDRNKFMASLTRDGGIRKPRIIDKVNKENWMTDKEGRKLLDQVTGKVREEVLGLGTASFVRSAAGDPRPQISPVKEHLDDMSYLDMLKAVSDDSDELNTMDSFLATMRVNDGRSVQDVISEALMEDPDATRAVVGKALRKILTEIVGMGERYDADVRPKMMAAWNSLDKGKEHAAYRRASPLMRIMNDFEIGLSKTEVEGRFDTALHGGEFSLYAAVRRAVARIAPPASKKNDAHNRPQTTAPTADLSGAETITTYPYFINYVIKNIAANAVKFSKDGAEIRVTVRYDQEKKEFLITIQDPGRGMPAEYLRRMHLNNPVATLPKGETDKIISSTGVGMPKIFEYAYGPLNGRIKVTSTWLNPATGEHETAVRNENGDVAEGLPPLASTGTTFEIYVPKTNTKPLEMKYAAHMTFEVISDVRHDVFNKMTVLAMSLEGVLSGFEGQALPEDLRALEQQAKEANALVEDMGGRLDITKKVEGFLSDGGAGSYQTSMSEFEIRISDARFAGGRLVVWARDGNPIAHIALEKISGRKMLLIDGIPEAFSHREDGLAVIVEKHPEILEQIVKLGYFAELGAQADLDQIFAIRRDSGDIVNDAVVAMRITEDLFHIYKADKNGVLTYEKFIINRFEGNIPGQLFKRAQNMRKADEEKAMRGQENERQERIRGIKGKFKNYPAGQQRLDGGAPATTGGIDFRALPLPVKPAEAFVSPDVRGTTDPQSAEALNKQWSDIQAQMRQGAMPYKQISEYMSACRDNRARGNIDQVMACIADILRLEEDAAVATPAELREILTTIG